MKEKGVEFSLIKLIKNCWLFLFIKNCWWFLLLLAGIIFMANRPVMQEGTPEFIKWLYPTATNIKIENTQLTFDLVVDGKTRTFWDNGQLICINGCQ